MATEIYLGAPSKRILDWIKTYTRITFTDRTLEEYDWSVEINRQTMIDAGLYASSSSWIKEPQTVEIGTKVTSIGGAFEGCRGLTSVMISDSVTRIGGSAFNSCSGLTSVTIPASVMSIGNWAFSNCSGLTNVTMKGDAPTVGTNAFIGVAAECVVQIPRQANGYNVANGKWQGMTVEYIENNNISVEP